jgi:hypothetical protein
MENLYSFPADQTMLFINNFVANVSLLISFGLVALMGLRSLRHREKRAVISIKKPEDWVKAA